MRRSSSYTSGIKSETGSEGISTPNSQFPTSNHSQLATPNSQQLSIEIGNWELAVGGGWEMGVGSWELVSSNLDRLDHDIVDRPILSASLRTANLAHDVHAAVDFAEDRVAVVEMRCRRQGDEELSAVRVRSGVGH